MAGIFLQLLIVTKMKDPVFHLLAHINNMKKLFKLFEELAYFLKIIILFYLNFEH